MIDRLAIPDEEKLIRLHLHTADSARAGTEPCLYIGDSNDGYQKALATLRIRFGNPYLVSQAWIDRVLKADNVKTTQHLQVFADTLHSCRDTLQALNCVDGMNSSCTLGQIMEKCP